MNDNSNTLVHVDLNSSVAVAFSSGGDVAIGKAVAFSNGRDVAIGKVVVLSNERDKWVKC